MEYTCVYVVSHMLLSSSVRLVGRQWKLNPHWQTISFSHRLQIFFNIDFIKIQA